MFSKNHITVYTDGSSFIKNDFYEASSGCVIFINNIEVCRFGCYHINGTNSLGEMYAMMMAIDRISDIKKDNPELKDYPVYYISDSKYVVESLRNWVFNWSKQGDTLWKGSSGNPVMYQWIIKYLYSNYIANPKWRNKSIILHTNGHIDINKKKSFIKAYNKAKFRNKDVLSDFGISFSIDDFQSIVNNNNIVDKLAEYVRINKLRYYEKVGSDFEWEIRKRNLQKRNQKIVIKSRKNESKI